MMGDIYAERGYGARAVGFGRKPGLVVVDFQAGFTDPAAAMGGAPMVEQACARTARLMRSAKAAGVPIIACVIAFPSPAAAPHWKVGPVHELIEGTPGTALDPRIAEAGPDVVLTKTAPSIFFATPAASILTREGVDTVIVTGCITSGCVRASIIDAFSLGFRVQVPEDCVGDHDEAAHRQNLADVGRRYADIITADAAEAALADFARRNDRA
jgi:maleamate amidohydrolase